MNEALVPALDEKQDDVHELLEAALDRLLRSHRL